MICILPHKNHHPESKTQPDTLAQDKNMQFNKKKKVKFGFYYGTGPTIQQKILSITTTTMIKNSKKTAIQFCKYIQQLPKVFAKATKVVRYNHLMFIPKYFSYLPNGCFITQKLFQGAKYLALLFKTLLSLKTIKECETILKYFFHHQSVQCAILLFNAILIFHFWCRYFFFNFEQVQYFLLSE